MPRPPTSTGELIAALRCREAYSHGFAGAVDVVQTHVSLLFFAGTRVFKVKKAVDLGFLDFRELGARRHFCEEEVRLNRRLAPGIYRRVAEIRRGEDGQLRIDGSGETVEYAVEMVRLPESGMLDRRLDEGPLDTELLDRLVDRLVEFHRAAATGPGVDEHALPSEVRARVHENLEGLAAFADVSSAVGTTAVLSSDLHRHLARWTKRFLDRHEDVLRERVGRGRAREGHGDLHAGNICVVDDRIVIYDCIEFEPAFRCHDVASEMAFLAMDLDARGHRNVGRDLVRAYADRTGDADLVDLVPLFKVHYALVRSKVLALRSVDAAIPTADRDASLRESMRYAQLAATYTLGQPLVLMCGLPGTGKSWAARVVASVFDAVMLQSDAVRKRLAHLPAAARGGEEIYTAAFTLRTYGVLERRARRWTGHGRPVVIDATFPTRSLRAPFLALDDRASGGVFLIELTTPGPVVRERLAARASDPEEISDADWTVHERARTRFESPDDVPPSSLVRMVSPAYPEMVTAALVDAMVLRGESGSDPG